MDSTTAPPTPFSAAVELISSTDLVIPAAYRTPGPPRQLHRVDESTPASLREWLTVDLGLERLNQVHEHLWMAGLPQLPRTLHEQIRIGRSVVLTEQADLHMVWSRDTIFIKPLPDYLLNHHFWGTEICPSQPLVEDARGLLLSYLWLVASKPDWKAAVDRGLINDQVTWLQWVKFTRSCLALGDGLDHNTLRAVNPRYIYGELRLERLSLIHRLSRNTRTGRTILRGYNYAYHDYRSFVARNFAWSITATIYLTIALTAMQVGLATTRLTENTGFQRAAYGFTIFAIVGPLVVLLAGAFILVVIFALNWRFARRMRTTALAEHPHLQNPSKGRTRHPAEEPPSSGSKTRKAHNASPA